MEVIGFQFAPSEVLGRKKDGSSETLSEALSRRLVQGILGENTVPYHQNFLEDGVYPIPLEESTHTMQLVMRGESAWIAIARKDPTKHIARSHVMVDREGNPISSRRRKIALVTAEKGEVAGIGIGRRTASQFTVEQYFCTL